MNSENSAQSEPVPLDCALGGNKIWDYGEDNDGWYVSRQNEQIAWAASEYWAERIAECMNKACLG